MTKQLSYRLLTFILVVTSYSLFSQGQNKRYVEEIALYHLDSLTKVDPLFKNFKYFTNGYLSSFRTDADTNHFMRVTPNILIKTPFKNLQIVEDFKLTSFAVPRRIRKNGSSTTLIIYGYTKLNDKYLVGFRIEEGESGKEALIIMNSNGDLIGRRYSTYIY